jgi:hypothetical protein
MREKEKVRGCYVMREKEIVCDIERVRKDVGEP